MPCTAVPPADAPPLEPAWLTETALALARGVATDRAFDRLPILADALEDAGCHHDPLLLHLRSDGPHEVGCWAFRRVLQTTLPLPGGVPLTFAWCPPGVFEMGSHHSDADDDEHPVRQVRVTRPLQVGIYPVTQEQWRAVMGTEPSFHRGDRRPVESVAWAEAVAFCERAAGLTGRAVRLPTEAEWEYFGRAGTVSEYHYGDEPAHDRMNSNESGDDRQTTDVGRDPPNPWGLFDTHGNVMEWCEDWFDAGFYAVGGEEDPACRVPNGSAEHAHRCCRGGSWRYDARGCRSALRNYRSPGNAENCLGFRVVFTADG